MILVWRGLIPSGVEVLSHRLSKEVFYYLAMKWTPKYFWFKSALVIYEEVSFGNQIKSISFKRPIREIKVCFLEIYLWNAKLHGLSKKVC